MNCSLTPASFTGTNLSLSTPQPHYIPGYTGYVPQEKFRPGHTFGVTSHRVLLDPCIHMSPRSILNNVHPEHCSDEFGRPGLGADPALSAQMALVNSRVNSLGRQQYQPNQVPGYTGFVPRYQTILGHTYSPACNRALARFEQDQWRDRLFTKELEALEGWRFCYKKKPWETGEVGHYVEDTPKKLPTAGCGCSGAGRTSTVTDTPLPPAYTATSLGVGMRCPPNPKDAIKMTPGYSGCEFAKRRLWNCCQEAMMDQTVGNVCPKPNAFKFSHPIRVQELYRHCEGMIPYYLGHVPGANARVGLTFGVATKNPRRHMEPNLQKPLCYPIN